MMRRIHSCFSSITPNLLQGNVWPLAAVAGAVLLAAACSDSKDTSPNAGSGGSSTAQGGSAPKGGSNSEGGIATQGGSSMGGETASGGAAVSSGGTTASTGGKASATGGSKATGTGGKGGAAGTTGGTGGTASSTGGAATGGSGGSVVGSGSAADIAKRLGRSTNFLIGMGNDLDNDHNKDGAYTLGTTLDLHYAYMSGLQGQGGWPDWNSGGTFVNVLTDSAKSHGVTPMFTLYAPLDAGSLNNDAFMTAYWNSAKLLFQRIGVFNAPAVVHFEPDFWGFMQQQSGGKASSAAAKVTSLAPDCASLPNTLVGVGRCLVALGRKYAPKAVLGFHASVWADPAPAKVAEFLNQVGSMEADIVVIETLDRDAGCFEAKGGECTRTDGPWYWDETNQTHPNFHDHLAWAKAIHDATGKPLLWWQMPFGVPSATSGGAPGKYRDNRVKYLFEHVDEFIAAGGVGAVFGVGAGNQTYINTDGGQFKTAVTKYFAAPVALP